MAEAPRLEMEYDQAYPLWSEAELDEVYARIEYIEPFTDESKRLLTKRISLEGYPLYVDLNYINPQYAGEKETRVVPFPDDTVFKTRFLADGSLRVERAVLGAYLSCDSGAEDTEDIEDWSNHILYELQFENGQIFRGEDTFQENGDHGEYASHLNNTLLLPDSPSLLSGTLIIFHRPTGAEERS